MPKVYQYIYPSRQSQFAPRVVVGNSMVAVDKNSCAVTSLMNFMQIGYDRADTLCTKYGRPKHKGMYVKDYHKMLTEEFGDKVELFGIFGSTYGAKYCKKFLGNDMQVSAGMTIGTFMKTYNKGTYVVFITGHFTVVRDGEIFDSHAIRSGTSVCCAWKLKI